MSRLGNPVVVGQKVRGCLGQILTLCYMYEIALVMGGGGGVVWGILCSSWQLFHIAVGSAYISRCLLVSESGFKAANPKTKRQERIKA